MTLKLSKYFENVTLGEENKTYSNSYAYAHIIGIIGHNFSRFRFRNVRASSPLCVYMKYTIKTSRTIDSHMGRSISRKFIGDSTVYISEEVGQLQGCFDTMK